MHGTRTGTAGVRPLQLAGQVVAYETSRETKGPPGLIENDLVVRDLTNGRILHKMPTGSTAEPETVGAGQAYSLVLKTDGAVAWIAGDIQECQLHTLDKRGARTLAAGPEIDPESLALAGNTLYWIQGGKPASATLN